MARAQLQGNLTSSMLALTLKALSLIRPGALGTFARIFPCATTGILGERSCSLFVPVVLWIEEERRYVHWDHSRWIVQGTPSSVACSDAWAWLSLTALNYMFCGGPRLLTRPMVHRDDLIEAQSAIVARASRFGAITAEEVGTSTWEPRWSKQSRIDHRISSNISRANSRKHIRFPGLQ